MPKVPVVDSIASSVGSIGASAARHLDFAIRGIMSGQGAVDGGNYLRLITGEQHPFGNMAILSDANSQGTSDAAVAALLDLKVPTMVLYTTGSVTRLPGILWLKDSAKALCRRWPST